MRWGLKREGNSSHATVVEVRPELLEEAEDDVFPDTGDESEREKNELPHGKRLPTMIPSKHCLPA